MPEGPTIVLVREKLLPLVGKTVQKVAGYESASKRGLRKRKLTGIQTWGKHLLLVFGDRTLRVHFLLFGSLAVNPDTPRRAKLVLHFNAKDSIAFYLCALELIDEPLVDHYDWSIDILSDQWKSAAAVKKIRNKGNTALCDCLMDQTIFSGVGNIIKNESLFRSELHPLARAAQVPAEDLKKLVKEVRRYAKSFLRDKKKGVLEKHWQAYEQEECPRCHIPLQKKILGKSKRRCYYCNNCQERY